MSQQNSASTSFLTTSNAGKPTLRSALKSGTKSPVPKKVRFEPQQSEFSSDSESDSDYEVVTATDAANTASSSAERPANATPSTPVASSPSSKGRSEVAQPASSEGGYTEQSWGPRPTDRASRFWRKS